MKPPNKETTMKTQSIKELIELCKANQCAVKLEACQTGVIATATSTRGHVFLQTTEYLDSNDPDVSEKLRIAVARVQ